MVVAGLSDKRVLLAFAVLVIAFVAWTQNLVENSALVFLAAAAVLVIALTGRVHPGNDNDFELHEKEPNEIDGLSEHPEAHEEEARGYLAGH
jgi:hypothetical protein